MNQLLFSQQVGHVQYMTNIQYHMYTVIIICHRVSSSFSFFLTPHIFTLTTLFCYFCFLSYFARNVNYTIVVVGLRTKKNCSCGVPFFVYFLSFFFVLLIRLISLSTELLI